MVYTSTNELPKKEKNNHYIFLAGSIDLNLPGNWRQKTIDKIGGKTHFFDPTISNHNQLNDIEMCRHIEWELDALELSNKIILNFLPQAESPISLVELGLYIRTNKLIIVCPKEFYKSFYVTVLCKKYAVLCFDNLDAALDCIMEE